MTRKQPKDVREDELLQAALEVFLEKGYEGASMEAIAHRAGVSKGAVYHHFSSKEALFMRANQRISQPVMAMVARAMANPSPVEGLRAYMREYLAYWAGRPAELSFTFLSMAKALQAPLLMDYYDLYVRETTAFFVGMFQRAVAMGELDLDDPQTYGISLMGALDGLVSYALVYPDEDLVGLASRAARIWLGGAKRD
jgi:AcrR family transcriptional regulator